MNSEIILSYLGNALMPDRDNTPLGEDAEKDFQAYHKSLRYFHLAWLTETIENLCHSHSGDASFTLDEYYQALEELESRNDETYELISDDESKELVIHTTSEIHIFINGTHEKPYLSIYMDGYRNQIMVYENAESTLYPSEFVELFTNIDAKLKQRTADIIISGLKDVVPDKLKPYFLNGKITKDMGHSSFDSGEYSIGHEIRLSVTDVHDMVYAYIPDYFWDKEFMPCTFNNVEYSYWLLTELAARLPNHVEFICQHRDDCGVSLTSPDSSLDDDEWVRRSAVQMACRDQKRGELSKNDYKDIMWYYHIDKRYSLQEFIAMSRREARIQHNYEQEISNLLKAYRDKVTINFVTEEIAIYLMADRDNRWDRECCLRFRYGSDITFLRDIDYYLTKAQELVSIFEESGDIVTAVGLCPKSCGNHPTAQKTKTCQ